MLKLAASPLSSQVHFQWQLYAGCLLRTQIMQHAQLEGSLHLDGGRDVCWQLQASMPEAGQLMLCGVQAGDGHLIQHEDLASAQDCARHAQQLPLPCAQVAARLGHMCIQATLQPAACISQWALNKAASLSEVRWDQNGVMLL